MNLIDLIAGAVSSLIILLAVVGFVFSLVAICIILYFEIKEIREECSECREEQGGDEDMLTPYCPNCGAKTDKEA